jgi:hypothetical protein
MEKIRYSEIFYSRTQQEKTDPWDPVIEKEA